MTPTNERGQRVLIIADDVLARAGLTTLLSGRPGCEVVGQIAGSEVISATLDFHRPDVVIWDMGWEPGQSQQQLTDLPESHPPVVALLSDDSHVAQARVAGAKSLLLRDAAVESLLAAIAATAQGLITLDPALDSVPPARGGSSEPLSENLTPRELEVLQLLAEGLPNKIIAQTLEISDYTVKFHVNSILSKLGAQSRTEAVTRAIRLGLIYL